ncbi:MAG TPA: hypothetical protein VH722_12440 [Alphaproteobacteria bacterium]|nr:hypothetical protein [Alphaproteobacteria bacterium]
MEDRTPRVAGSPASRQSWRRTLRGRAVAVSVIILAAMPCQSRGSTQDGVTGTTRGFVFEYFWYAMAYGADDCPDGLAVSMEKYYKHPYTAGRPGAPKVNALVAKGEKGTEERCKYPAAFEEPPLRTAQGRVAFGLNLDGGSADKPAPNTCRHTKFTSPDGQPGVDNQLYRALACIAAYRPEQHFQSNTIRDFVNSARQDGAVTTLMEITGLTDDRNASDVQVGLYSSAEPTQLDSERRGEPYDSYAVTKNTRWHNVTHGKVVDGVLTTDPIDIRLDHYQGEGLKAHSEYYIRGARLRVKLLPDGKAEGILAGYSDVESAYSTEFGQWYPTLEIGFGGSCPALYAAIHNLADGYPDPATGRCTAISTAYKIEAVPAFLIHPKADDKASIASAGPENGAASGTLAGWFKKLGW